MKKIELANKELEAFLRKEKVLKKFINNINTFSIDTIDYLLNKECLTILEFSVWSYTQEGHDFWNKLNNKYELQKNQSCQK